MGHNIINCTIQSDQFSLCAVVLAEKSREMDSFEREAILPDLPLEISSEWKAPTPEGELIFYQSIPYFQ